jgi:two-component system response regulator AtoC
VSAADGVEASTMKRSNVLVIDHDVTTLEALRVGLANDGLAVEAHADAREAFRACAVKRFDVVIAGATVAPVGGIGVLERMHEQDPMTPVIVLASRDALPAAVEAVKRGAFDYIEAPFRVAKVRSLVERALEVRRLRQEVSRLQAEVRASADSELIAQSPAMAGVLEAVRRAAASDAGVLLVGDPGTGKTLVARTIHRRSLRTGKPFVVGDCSALGEGLVESELFGHVRGAFAGAVGDHRGLFEVADGGTLLLSSIDRLSKAAQLRLLEALDERRVRPLGGTAARPVNVRLVAATRTALAGQVKARRFRDDLYTRLGAVRALLPPLRERHEDIPLLANYFVKTMRARLGAEPPAISPEAMATLMENPWPGNVRQLRDTMTCAALLADGTEIRPEHLENPAATADRVPVAQEQHAESGAQPRDGDRP